MRVRILEDLAKPIGSSKNLKIKPFVTKLQYQFKLWVPTQGEKKKIFFFFLEFVPSSKYVNAKFTTSKYVCFFEVNSIGTLLIRQTEKQLKYFNHN